MIGDRLLVYDPANDMFYQGRDKYRRVIAGQPAPAKWTPKPELAKCSNALTWYMKLCEELGGGVRIVSETEARRIVRMRQYREARNV
jgi:hypothetical protein